MIGLAPPSGPLEVLCLGAHPDDIEIGCGATLLTLAERPETTVHGVVLTATPARAAEARASLPRFVPGAGVEVHDLPDGRLPDHWNAVKEVLEEIAQRHRPGLVLAPRPDDAHQDHRLLGRLVTTVWRDSLVLHYEIPKWDGDLGGMTHYVGVSAETGRRKVDLLNQSFPSQLARDWWDDEMFLGLMRVRGMESRAPLRRGLPVRQGPAGPAGGAVRMNADLAALADDLAAAGPEATAMGELLHARMTELYPLPRSLTGDGVRATLAMLGQVVDIEQHEVPTGTEAFDWLVNDEWNLREAWIADASGKRIVDVARHNLHVVGYSVPVRARLSLDELRPHLHSLPEHPDWIPYRTSYYHRDWGFCLEDRVLQSLDDGPYDVVIDAELGPGSMTYGELVIPGESEEEVMMTAHLCHPSIANDNLSGLVLATRARQRPDLPAEPAVHLPLPVRARHRGLDHLAQPQPGHAVPNPARARAHRARWPRAVGLQAHSPR